MTPLASSRLAWVRLHSGDFQDQEEKDRLQLLAQLWEEEPARAEGLGLQVEFIAPASCVILRDIGGYLTTILTPTSLWSVLEMEAKSPGFLRRELTKTSTPYPSPAEVHTLVLKEDQKITKLPPHRRESTVPSFSSLDLNI